ncbi:MFS general substrate transporter [Suillus clintonianus]|uniref:MFS general substrate transporter n=1 Tax=Suillus clintonianus TaxID=1904413 RepID=UPI001B87E70E|nr:MFS general substrate transporter [Suillus clintonianus]KAG2154079.1 MFS general substrate transporter [Suillus clintonianus]
MAEIQDVPPTKLSSERAPLLPERQDAIEPYSRRQFSPLTLLIPLAVATRLTSTLPTTTLLGVIQSVICRLWLASNGNLPSDGEISKELCAVPEVEKTYAAVISAVMIFDGLGAMIACSAISYISSRIGRKPVILGTVAISFLGYSLMVCSQYLPGWLEASLMIASLFVQTFSGIMTTTFIVNVYAVDISSPEDRTPILSAINGWATLGQTASFALGGLLTTKTNDPLIVFYISISTLGAVFVYILAFLPESFPEEKRDELRRQRLAQQNVEPSVRRNLLNRFTSAIAIAFEPLKQLAPTRNADGRQNWRVVYCAIHIIITMIANSYTAPALILLYTTKYGYNPAQTGTVLTTLSFSAAFTLTYMVPSLIRILRPIYARKVVLLEDQQGPGDDTVVAMPTDRLDIHIAFVSWVICAVAYSMAAATSTRTLHLIAVTVAGFSAGHTPIIRSLVASSVDPLKQGEVLAAIEMISSIGAFLSPLVMGSIFTATISTQPMLVFHIHAVIVIAAASLLFLIRDSDRYQKP